MADWKVITGDALEVLPTIPAASIGVIWTDPPYGHGNMDGDLQAARVRDGVSGARVREAEPIANDAGPGFDALMDGFFTEAARILSPDCCCCCCCMGGGGPTTTFARRDYEFVMVAHRKGGRLSWNEGTSASSNIVRDAPVQDRVHPNEKPLGLVLRFLKAHALPGMTVLDPFCGSGTTGIACVLLDLPFIGIELDPAYAAIARRRIADAAPLFTAPAGARGRE